MPTEDSTSSSDKKATSTVPTLAGDEEEDEEGEDTEIKVSTNATDKLTMAHLQAFGFNLAEEVKRQEALDASGTKEAGLMLKAIAASKSNTQSVVYGGDPDDADFNDDYDDTVLPGYGSDEDGEAEEHDEEEDEQEAGVDKAGRDYFDGKFIISRQFSNTNSPELIL